ARTQVRDRCCTAGQRDDAIGATLLASATARQSLVQRDVNEEADPLLGQPGRVEAGKDIAPTALGKLASELLVVEEIDYRIGGTAHITWREEHAVLPVLNNVADSADVRRDDGDS